MKFNQVIIKSPKPYNFIVFVQPSFLVYVYRSIWTCDSWIFIWPKSVRVYHKSVNSTTLEGPSCLQTIATSLSLHGVSLTYLCQNSTAADSELFSYSHKSVGMAAQTASREPVRTCVLMDKEEKKNTKCLPKTTTKSHANCSLIRNVLSRSYQDMAQCNVLKHKGTPIQTKVSRVHSTKSP